MSIRGLDAYLTTDPASDYEGPCGAWSPDGKFACTLAVDHPSDTHEHHIPQAVWHFNNCGGTLCEACVDFEALDLGYPIRTGSRLHDYSGEYATVRVATWPRRDDDFDEEGNAKLRGGIGS